jgi:transcription antitermination factor NusG
MSWFVVRTEPARERTAQQFLKLAGFSTYIPFIRERYAKDGRRRERLRPLFSSYAFVAFQDGRWWDARWSVGVAGVIMAGDGPAQLGDHIIDEIKSRERGGAVELPKRETFRVGDEVRIVAGPMQGLRGLFQGQRSHERVAILLALLSRVELPKADIEASA